MCQLGIIPPARVSLGEHYDDTRWESQEALHLSIEILYADLWLSAATHHFNMMQKVVTYSLRTNKRQLWTLRIGKVYVELVDCSLSKAPQWCRYQNLITHESQHPCAQETPTSLMISAIPSHVVSEVE